MSSSPWNLSGGGRRLLARRVPAVESQRELAPLGGERRPIRADDVPEVETDQALERLGAEDVLACVELNPARAIDEVDEGGLAVAPAGGDPSGDPVALLGLVAGLEALVGSANAADLDPIFELVREGLDSGIAEPVELLAALGEQVRRRGLGGRRASGAALVRHQGEPNSLA